MRLQSRVRSDAVANRKLDRLRLDLEAGGHFELEADMGIDLVRGEDVTIHQEIGVGVEFLRSDSKRATPL